MNMADRVNSLLSLSWRLPLEGARQLTKLAVAPLSGLAGGDAASIDRSVDKLFRATEEAAGQLQEQTLDLLVDAATLRPFVQALQQNFNQLGPEPEIGSQKQPELEYLQAVNDAGPNGYVLNILMLTVQYTAVNRAAEGGRVFEGYLRDYDARLVPWQRGVYLSSLALLLAHQAQTTPLWRLVEILELGRRSLDLARQAKEVTAALPDFDENMGKLVARWVSGLLNAALPAPLGDRQTALADLEWVSATIMSDVYWQTQGYIFLRETWFNLARLYDAAGDPVRAEEYLRRSTYKTFEPHTTLFATLFACAPSGLRDGIKAVGVAGDGHVFNVTGHDMSEFNYIISKDRQHLIAIDSGTRWQTAEAAYQYLLGYLAQQGIAPPPLTTVIFTHAHWDHIGGQAFYRRVNPEVRFYSRYNYRTEQEKVVFLTPPYQWFLSDQFSLQPVADYRPDVLVEPGSPAQDGVVIGGTRIEFKLIQGGGGETVDGMFVHLPDYNILYAGDFIVPWIGSPYNAEGDMESLLASLDWITEIKPVIVLHGHGALDFFFPNWEPLAKIRPHLAWLRDETLRLISQHLNRQDIQEKNLYPQGILAPDQQQFVQLAYILFRETVINRVFRQHTGYWGKHLRSVDYLTNQELGSIFSRYLGLSAEQIAVAADRMTANGDLELAGRIVDWALTQFPDSEVLHQARHQTFQLLKQKWQLINVFKLVMYSEHIQDPLPQLPLGETPQGYKIPVSPSSPEPGSDFDLGYSNASFQGDYNFSIIFGPRDITGFGATSSDGKGNFSGIQEINAGSGQLLKQRVVGTYRIFSNGTGVAHIELTAADGTTTRGTFDYVVLEAKVIGGVKLATQLQGMSREPAVDPSTGRPFDPPQIGVSKFQRLPS
jgi:glyoxylase-like metal-dependent hydrolase (beta-lactamase superfamily II)